MKDWKPKRELSIILCLLNSNLFLSAFSLQENHLRIVFFATGLHEAVAYWCYRPRAWTKAIIAWLLCIHTTFRFLYFSLHSPNKHTTNHPTTDIAASPDWLARAHAVTVSSVKKVSSCLTSCHAFIGLLFSFRLSHLALRSFAMHWPQALVFSHFTFVYLNWSSSNLRCFPRSQVSGIRRVHCHCQQRFFQVLTNIAVVYMIAMTSKSAFDSSPFSCAIFL